MKLCLNLPDNFATLKAVEFIIVGKAAIGIISGGRFYLIKKLQETPMKLTSLRIQNFKSIHDMYIPDIENALILVGQNNTGKTTVLDAIRAVGGDYQIGPEDFGEAGSKVQIRVTLSLTEEDMDLLQRRGVVSQYRKKEAWRKDFCMV